LPAVLLALLLGACTSVPFDYPRTPSEAIPSSTDSHYGTLYQEWKDEHGELSGFLPLIAGIDALGARLVMMERAESSIDAQYFLIKPDQAGELFLGKLLRAADRGVRVRLLIDDIFTPRMDSDLALMNSHPNIEVRLFNPISRGGIRKLNFLLDFERANRRMHNKSLTIDNVVTVVGGRNIADEYYQIRSDVNFADFDLIGIGPVAQKGLGFI
jgi:putative cardiolipin synthase